MCNVSIGMYLIIIRILLCIGICYVEGRERAKERERQEEEKEEGMET